MKPILQLGDGLTEDTDMEEREGERLDILSMLLLSWFAEVKRASLGAAAVLNKRATVCHKLVTKPEFISIK